ncbi:nickel pincer cofactor biosynthesis protein LarC [Halorarum salinum]|uniref:Putative nickel insertion protein n=1 Tax=Halorarum salinum TaxID=2743089 RepID=A0A7D5QAK8_9EURY|nr:nickel pincer cofactor biosynthesis protein LarC [Halobaculum salinum]QLG61539.1 nickel pincer cofactor biosynthesis protein LarC [Halobaculum salinum]
MRTLAFDGRMGAAGDMLLGALVAAGADPAVLDPVEDALPVTYEFETVEKCGIAATRAHVVHDEARADGGEDGEAHGHDDAHDHYRGHDHSHGNGEHHSHDHSHDDSHGRSHGHDHDHGAEGHGPQRTYAEVVEFVEGMGLPEPVESDALATFEVLGEAESSVHGKPLADTHFHEVGADDAIADVVGCCLLFADLAPEHVVTTPLATGDGEVEFSHGVYPVPVPAVVEIAERADWSLRGGPVDAELLTPTGAAILAHFADGTDRLPPLRVAESGYGAGGYDFPDRPNVLRAIVGEAADGGEIEPATASTGRAGLVRDDVAVLETNLDDATPEVLGGLHGALREVGALDVAVLPATMKKSRPGHLVKVVCKPEDAEAVARRLAEETGTLGVREGGASHRWIAEREFETVELELGGGSFDVAVKVASDVDGEVYDVSAEYDDAAAAARESGVPTREVMRRAEAAARER